MKEHALSMHGIQWNSHLKYDAQMAAVFEEVEHAHQVSLVVGIWVKHT